MYIDPKVVAEEEATERYEEAQIALMEAEAIKWREKWPNACISCRGEGAYTTYGTYWTPPENEMCTRMEKEYDAEKRLQCCRCMVPETLSPEGEGPCSNCGWNYDDKEPSYY